MAADVNHVVRTRREDGHTTIQSVETDREEAEPLADFIADEYCDDVMVDEVPADTPVDWDGRTTGPGRPPEFRERRPRRRSAHLV